MRASLGLLRSLVVYWRPGRQAGLRRMYAPFVGPGDLVFDVGAHLGDRTAAFAALGARVVALEPQPSLVPWLRRLVGSRPGVMLRAEAVGREAGTATLAVSRANPTVSTLAEAWRETLALRNRSFEGVLWDASVDVPVTTLDALIDEYGLPAFCKIDVEGHEAEVLAGLGRAIPALSVEFVSGTHDVTRACFDRLARLGDYEYNVIPGEKRRFVFDHWQERAELEAWLDGGADGATSGDVYARLRGP